MTVTQMSLHRIISEIKNLESNLANISALTYVNTAIESASAEHVLKKAEAVKSSQSNFDKVNSSIKNLAALKAARNLANSTTKVSIGGVSMTIDEALAFKASLPYRESLVNNVLAQFTRAQMKVDQANAAIEVKFLAQLTSMTSNGAKKLEEKEIIPIRAAIERDSKVSIVHVEGLKETIETLKQEIERFKVEVDYVLSEINATTVVEVNFSN